MTNYPDTCSNYINDYSEILRGKNGVEIGGPSRALMSMGIYTSPASLDNVNYAADTLWSTHTSTAYSFAGKTSPGTVYIADVVNLSIFKDASYDFVFASHVLEHLINPLQGLKEMTRILKPGGFCILVLPWKNNTFDHKRPITPFAELLEHYNEHRDEHDVSDHLDAILKDYDLSRDPGAGTMEQFKQRCQNQFANRALHVHVFDFALMQECLHFFGYDVVDVQLATPYHQIMLASLRRPS